MFPTLPPIDENEVSAAQHVGLPLINGSGARLGQVRQKFCVSGIIGAPARVHLTDTSKKVLRTFPPHKKTKTRRLTNRLTERSTKYRSTARTNRRKSSQRRSGPFPHAAPRSCSGAKRTRIRKALPPRPKRLMVPDEPLKQETGPGNNSPARPCPRNGRRSERAIPSHCKAKQAPG